MTLGLSLIVRNGARTLRRALEPFAGVADEIVAVDTGSSDGTVELLESMGARVVRDDWRDDFAAPRNLALEHATTDWIFSIDADEWMTGKSVAAIRDHTSSVAADAFVLETVNFVNYSDPATTFPTTGADAAIAPCFTLSSKVRLFRASVPGGRAKWEGRVHELVDFSAARAGYRIARSSLRLLHDGLLAGRSAEHYLSLAQAALDAGEAHPGIILILGMDAIKKGRTDEGESLLRRAAALEPRYAAPSAWLARLLHATRRSDEAVALLLDALKTTVGAPEILSVLIEIYDARGETTHAATMRELGCRMHPSHPAFRQP